MTSLLRRFTVALSMVILASATLVGLSAPAQAADTGTITGTVTGQNGTPLSGVLVQVLRENGPGVLNEWDLIPGSRTTDAQGQFTWDGLTPGEYTVAYHPQDGAHLSEYWNDAASLDDAQTLTVAADGSVTANAQLTVSSHISGTVTGPDGNPVEDVTVYLYAWDEDNPATGTSSGAHTDAQGNYTLSGVRAGTYVVHFITKDSSGNNLANVIGEWWNNKRSYADATTITVTTGQTITGIDAQLEAGSTLSGTVSGAGSGPLAGAEVSLYYKDSTYDSWSRVATTTSGADGSYSISAIEPGSYAVRYSHFSGGWAYQYWDGSAERDSSQLAPVALSQNLTKNVTLQPGASFSGKVDAVVDGSPTTLANPSVEASRLNSDGTWESITSVNGDSSGQYSLTGLPAGTYRLMSSGDSTGSWAWRYVGGAYLTEEATSYTVTAGQNFTAPQLTLEKGVSISGEFYQADQSRINGPVTAWILWERSPGQFVPYSNGGAAGSDVNYQLGGMAPGRYKVAFVSSDSSYTTQYWNQKSTLDESTIITAEPGDKITQINSSLTAGPTAAPAAPTGLSLVSSAKPNAGELVASWDTVAAASSYTVTATPRDGSDPIEFSSTVSTATLRGLDPAASYDLTVTATNAHGTSSPSVAVRATTLAEGGSVGFNDVATDHVFGWEIAWLSSTGVTTGYDDGTFRPSQEVLREQMAAFLYRMAGSPSVEVPTTSPFLDVPTTHTFYKEIVWLASTGITTGYDVTGGKEFRGSQPVLREQMAAFLHRFADNPSVEAPTTSPFLDLSTGHTFYSQIVWLADTSITTGYDVTGGKEFRGSQPVLREQMAAFLYRYNQLG